MKIAMRKSVVFDSLFLVHQTQFCLLEMLNPKHFALHLKNWALIQWSLSLCSEVAEHFIFPADRYTSLNIHFLLSYNISPYNISIHSSQAATASQKLHTTLLALPHLIWTQTSQRPGKCSEWLLQRVQQLQGPLSKSLHCQTFLIIGILKLIFDC